MIHIPIRSTLFHSSRPNDPCNPEASKKALMSWAHIEYQMNHCSCSDKRSLRPVSRQNMDWKTVIVSYYMMILKICHFLSPRIENKVRSVNKVLSKKTLCFFTRSIQTLDWSPTSRPWSVPIFQAGRVAWVGSETW